MVYFCDYTLIICILVVLFNNNGNTFIYDLPFCTTTVFIRNSHHTIIFVGTIFVDGFQQGIGREGIQVIKSASSRSIVRALKLPMKDRLVLLSQLGQGASSIVYKV